MRTRLRVVRGLFVSKRRRQPPIPISKHPAVAQRIQRRTYPRTVSPAEASDVLPDHYPVGWYVEMRPGTFIGHYDTERRALAVIRDIEFGRDPMFEKVRRETVELWQRAHRRHR